MQKGKKSILEKAVSDDFLRLYICLHDAVYPAINIALIFCKVFRASMPSGNYIDCIGQGTFPKNYVLLFPLSVWALMNIDILNTLCFCYGSSVLSFSIKIRSSVLTIIMVHGIISV